MLHHSKSILTALLITAWIFGSSGCGSESSTYDSGVIFCETGDDCPVGWFCNDGVCDRLSDGGTECIEDSDCPGDQVCREGKCTAELPDGGIDGGDDGGDSGPGMPDILVAPEALDFGDVQLGQSVSQQLVISNAGTADLTIFSIEFETGTSSEFSSQPAGTLGLVLEAGGDETVDIIYAPLDGKSDSGALLIVSDDPDEALTRIPLTSSYKGSTEVTVVAEPGTVEPEVHAIDFGQVQLGDDRQESFTLANDGGTDLVIESIGLSLGSSTELSIIQQALNPVPPGGSTQVDIIYAPQDQIGADTGVVEIVCNDPAEPLPTVDVSAVGTDPDLEIDPPGVDFGPIYQGFQAGPVILTVKNSGFGTLQVNSVGFTAGSSDDFDLRELPSFPQNLDGGEFFECEIYFAPSAAVERTGAVHVESSDLDNTSLDVTVIGVGSACPEGYWDINGDPDDGCEYECYLNNGGVEDCNGDTDAGDTGLVPIPCENQTGACAGAVHRISLCLDGYWQPCECTDYEDNSQYYSEVEVCDGVDNDCDSIIDDDLTTRQCQNENGWGTCYGTEWCDGANGWVDCDAPAASEEICDTLDNDCDTFIDGADNSLRIEPCEMQDGVCAGSVHRASLCQDGDWQLCQAVDYGASYGVEICGNALDEDCSGAADDKDVDGDLFLDEACGGMDCDDMDLFSNPDASERQDTRDNDCDGIVDEGLIPAGAVIVTEIMKNPAAVNDTYGEYFEVTNVWTSAVNLDSFIIRDLGTDAHQIVEPAGIVIEPGESATLCRNENSTLNGGVVCDYDYDDFILGQTSGGEDEVILELDGVEIDRVVYVVNTWPEMSGHSMNLDPAAYDLTANDEVANWCDTPTSGAYQLPAGDWGTPGALNPTCSGDLAVLDVEPDSGIDAGSETITVIGAGFGGVNEVQIGGLDCAAFTVVDDTHISCTTPARPPGDYDVTVVRGVNIETLLSGYRYTGEDSAPDIGWCDLQWPASANTPVGVPTPLIFGRVYSHGITQQPGPPPNIIGQVGFGPPATDPRTTPGWLWFEATWNPSCPDCENDDEFMESLTISADGSYSYAYRFSEDGGYWFVYCDFNPGTSDGFSTEDLGQLTVE